VLAFWANNIPRAKCTAEPPNSRMSRLPTIFHVLRSNTWTAPVRKLKRRRGCPLRARSGDYCRGDLRIVLEPPNDKFLETAGNGRFIESHHSRKPQLYKIANVRQSL
jgi:hypothetical protein